MAPVTAQVMMTLLVRMAIGGSWLSKAVRLERFEMLEHALAKRCLLLGCPLPEALARLHAEFARGDQILEVPRRSRRAVKIREHGFVNGEREVGADEVRILER